MAQKITPSKVDEFARLDEKVKQFKPTAARHEELRKEILAAYDDAPGEKPAVARGKLYELHISKAEDVRHIRDIRALAGRLKDKFFDLCGFTLAAAEKHLDEAEIEKYIETEEHAGKRRITGVFQKAA